MSLNLEAVRRSIDRIAASQDQITRTIDRIATNHDQMTSAIDGIAANQDQMTPNIDRNATSQEQMAHGVDQLAAGREQMTREIIKLQEVEPHLLYKNSKPQPRPASAPSAHAGAAVVASTRRCYANRGRSPGSPG
jgi:septal ring factor EnvC (AmiA/AmiB activator)